MPQWNWATPCDDTDIQAFANGFRDSRVAGIIPMAGAGNFGWFEEGAFQNREIPALVMSGDKDEDDPQRLWDISEGTSMIWIDIEGACHQAFALGGCLDLNNEDGFRLINGYALAFARQLLLNDNTTGTVDLLNGGTVPDGIVIQTETSMMWFWLIGLGCVHEPDVPWLAAARIYGSTDALPPLHSEKSYFFHPFELEHNAKAVLTHPRPEWWDWFPVFRRFSDKPLLDEALIESDALRLKQWFMDNGWLDAEISWTHRIHERSGGTIVDYTAKAGARYTVADTA